MAISYILSTCMGSKGKRQRVQRDGGAIAGAIDGALAPNAPRLVSDLGTE